MVGKRFGNRQVLQATVFTRLSSVWEVGLLSEMVCGLRFIVSLMGHWQLGVSQGMQHVARSLSSKTEA